MPNIASILKSEIARVARKEIRAEVESLKKSSGNYRTEIAALKRRVQSLERELSSAAKPKPSFPTEPSGDPTSPSTFSAKALAAQRARLGISADECGRLLGSSGQAVYKWEAGKSRPRAKYLAAISALRNLGKKEAAAALASLPVT